MPVTDSRPSRARLLARTAVPGGSARTGGGAVAYSAAMEAVRPLIEGAFGYLKEHPDELLRVLRNALALRFGLPLAAVRWFAGRKSAKGPRDMEIVAVPPGISVAASFDLMSTPLRASAHVFVERVDLGPEALRFEIRFANVQLRVLDDRVESPLAALLRSGALDLSKPGNLVAYMPKRPALLVDAKGDRVVIDLLRHGKLAADPRVKRWLARIAPLITVSAVRTDDDHLDVALKAFPDGVAQAVESVRRTL